MTEIKKAHCARCGAAMLPNHGHDGPCRLFVAAGDTAKLARGKLAASLSLQDELVEALENAVDALESYEVSPLGGLRKMRSLLTRIKSERDRA